MGLLLGPQQSLDLYCLFVFQCDHNEYSKIQCTLVCGHLHIGVMMMVLHHHVYGGKWRKKQNPMNVWCTWWHLHKGIYTFTKRQPEANIFLPFTIGLNQQLQKLNTDPTLCSRLDHMIVSGIIKLALPWWLTILIL